MQHRIVQKRNGKWIVQVRKYLIFWATYAYNGFGDQDVEKDTPEDAVAFMRLKEKIDGLQF